MAVKKAIYNVDNGSGFDEIHFRTSEDMIEGAIQSLENIGYRKLPGGLIMQWGSILINSGTRYTSGNFPVAFPTRCLTMVAAPDYISGQANITTILAVSIQLNGYTVYARDVLNLQNPMSYTTRANYIAIGY